MLQVYPTLPQKLFWLLGQMLENSLYAMVANLEIKVELASFETMVSGSITVSSENPDKMEQ